MAETLVYDFPGVWKVRQAGEILVRKRAYAWSCDKPGCPAQGVQLPSAQDALDAVQDHFWTVHDPSRKAGEERG